MSSATMSTMFGRVSTASASVGIAVSDVSATATAIRRLTDTPR
jgi:hypothetical protein